jgi:hypothetical protein
MTRLLSKMWTGTTPHSIFPDPKIGAPKRALAYSRGRITGYSDITER